jgi:hypothetical protein
MYNENSAILKKYEESLTSLLPVFNNLELVEYTEEVLDGLNQRLIKLQESLYSKLEEKGLDRGLILGLSKEEYPNIFRFFRLRNIQNLIPTKIED